MWFCYAGGKHALASHYALSSDPDNWERAARIEPDNPETWYRLGRYRQLDFDHADVPLSITYYRRAIKLIRVPLITSWILPAPRNGGEE